MVLRVDRPTIELWNALAGWPSRAEHDCTPDE